jgi:hypothetical protein
MSYLRTGSGRLFTMAAGIALTGGGIATLVGGSGAVPIMCFSLLLTILASLFAAGISEHTSTGAVITVIAAGPFAFFLYVLGLGLAIEHAPQAGYAFGILGALALARAAFVTTEKEATSRRELPVHAH